MLAKHTDGPHCMMFSVKAEGKKTGLKNKTGLIEQIRGVKCSLSTKLNDAECTVVERDVLRDFLETEGTVD